MKNVTALIILAIALLAGVLILVLSGFEATATVVGLTTSLASLVGAVIFLFKENPPTLPPADKKHD